MTFWRVTFGPDGAIATVEVVDGPEHGERWVIVEAQSEMVATERAAAMRAEGRCQCGRKLDRETRSCLFCADRWAAARRRKSDDEVEPNTLAIEHARAQAAPADVRLATLIEVQRAWQETPNVGRFSRWLVDAIARARGGKAAA